MWWLSIPVVLFAATVLAPFTALTDVTAAVPKIIASGIGPLLVEYIDFITMDAIASTNGVELGVDPAIKAQALAYLVVVLEDRRDDRLEENTEELANLLSGLGALDVYVLPSTAGAKLIEAREKAFWTAKAAGAATLNYGLFINAVVNFLIVAFAIFLLIRAVNRMKKPVPAAAATTRECPRCLSSVPLKATRCAFCTSDLSPS